MNITIITIVLPYPLNSGGAQAQYNIIDLLRKKHRITMIFPENGYNSLHAMKQLQQLWPEVTFKPYRFTEQLKSFKFLRSKVERAAKLKLMPHSNAFQIERILKPYGYDLSTRFISFLHRTIAESHPDVIQVEFYPMLDIVYSLPKDIPNVFVHHEIRFVRNKRMLGNLKVNNRDIAEFNKLKECEIKALNRFDHVITLTSIDRNILIQEGVTTPVTVSPAAISSDVEPYEEWNDKLTFLGGRGHIPNEEGMQWFLSQVAPLINWKTDFPKVMFHIIGNGWSEANLDNLSSLPVHCHGFVERLAPAVKGSIMIVPILTGSGMRMKILEGAALGLPVITTSVGVEGLDFPDKEACLIANSPKEFAQALVNLMRDRVLRKQLATQAQHIFEQKYSKKALAEKRNNVYKEITSK